MMPRHGRAAWSLALLAIAAVPTGAFARSLPPTLDEVMVEPADAPAAAQPAPRPLVWDDGSHWRPSAGIGIRFGTFLVNNLDPIGTVTQGHLDGGLRRGRLLVSAELGLLSITLPPVVSADTSAALTGTSPPPEGDRRALVHRAGVFARYSYARVGARDAGADLWLEGGAGVQHLRWDAGGVWTRPDLAFGLGGTVWALGRHEHGGLSAGLRITLAPRSDVDGAPRACGGPCDRASPPTGWDRSFMFDVTLHVGR